jgi:transcriptional regulator with XRE-family HTH domain
VSATASSVDGLKVARARQALPLENGRNVSQQRVADRAGIHVVTLSNIERGAVTNTTLETIARLAKALRVGISDLLADEADEEGDRVMRVRRLRAELVLAGRDDLAQELGWLAGLAGIKRALVEPATGAGAGSPNATVEFVG